MVIYQGVIGLILILFIPPLQLPKGELVVEYSDDFGLPGSLYSAKLAVADFDSDGRDDIILSDDFGSFHIFALHDGEFEELWISDPLDTESGSIKWLGVVEGEKRTSRVFVLDSSNSLHMYSYKGYILGETQSWDVPSEGYLIDAVIISSPSQDSFEFLRLAMVKGNRFVVETYALDETLALTKPALGIDIPLVSLPAIAVDEARDQAVLLGVRSESMDGNAPPQFKLDISTLEGVNLTSFLLKHFNPEGESIALVTLGEDGKIIALGFGPPDEVGCLNMRLWREDTDTINPGRWRNLVAHRDVGSGDVDGDGRTEFITIGIDGILRIIDEDPLSFSLDGEHITPARPSILELGEIYQDAEFLKAIGVEITEKDNELHCRRAELEISFTGGPEEWIPTTGQGPSIRTRMDPYGVRLYPLSRICIALGFAYRYRSDLGEVEVYS